VLIAGDDLPGRCEQVFFHDKGLKNEPKRCNLVNRQKTKDWRQLPQPRRQAFDSELNISPVRPMWTANNSTFLSVASRPGVLPPLVFWPEGTRRRLSPAGPTRFSSNAGTQFI